MTRTSADERRSSRSTVMLNAAIENGDDQISVRVANLSEHGALVLGDALPVEDTPVTFQCNGLVVESFVAWVQEPLAGIEFDEPVQPQDVLRKVPRPRQALSKDFRRPGFRWKRLTDSERQMVEQWGSRPRTRLGE